MSVLDYIAIGIILGSGIIAYYRGLIKTIYNLFSFLIGIILTKIVYPLISEVIIKYTNFDDKIKSKIMEGLNLNELNGNIISPQDEIEYIGNLQVPDIFKKILISNNNDEVYSLLNVESIEEYIGSIIATIVVNAIIFIVVFIGVMILLKIIANSLDLIAKLPVLKQINRFSGLIAGVLLGIIIVWILCIILSIGIGVQGNKDLLVLIDKSPVIKLFYNNNLLIDMMKDVLKTML